MRAVTTVALAAFVALSLGAAPASAHPWHYNHYHGYWGGPGLLFGLAGAAILGLAAESYCVRYVPVYDAWGNYRGTRAVNAC